MTDADPSDEHSDLYAKAKAATEGPRSVQECCDSIEIHVGECPHEYELCYIDTYGAEPAGMEYARHDAAFIAAAHPAAVLALIDEVRRLRKEVEIKDSTISKAFRAYRESRESEE